MSSKCPVCEKAVYMAEKYTSDGKDYHRACHRCERCKKTIEKGKQAMHDGKMYCQNPCHAALFGPGGFRAGAGTAGSAKYEQK